MHTTACRMRILLLLVLSVALSPMICAAAGGSLLEETELAAGEWKQIEAAIKYPRNDLTLRRAIAFRSRDRHYQYYTASLVTNYYEQADTYRKYYSTFCRKANDTWTCDRPQDTVELSDGTGVAVSGVNPLEVVEIARFLRDEPNNAWLRRQPDARLIKLIGVGYTDGMYSIRVRFRDPDCTTFLRIQRSADGALVIVNEGTPVTLCA